MARRKQSGLDFIASMPWPVGMTLGVVAFMLIRYGLGMYLSASGSSITQGLGRQMLTSGMLVPLAWLALAVCWVGALLSYLGSRKRTQLLAGQTGLDSLRAMDWREFELLVGEAFRRRGYAVEETGMGGADGGIDLILSKDGRRELVQCKQWRKAQVSAPVVWEMWGLAAHHGVEGVKSVCVGQFSSAEGAFARDKPIQLINGTQLAALVREIQTPGSPTTQVERIEPTLARPTCPTCASRMVHRANRRTGEPFWGCSDYPRCRGTRPG